MEKDWVNADIIGDWYIEEVLYKFKTSLLFVCRNNNEERFLCFNIDDKRVMFIFCKIDNDTLIDLLKKKITMYDVFRKNKSKEVMLTCLSKEDENLYMKKYKTNEISDDILPEKGKYLECDEMKFSEYVKYLHA